MKFFRPARLILVLAPLCLGLLPQCAPAQAGSAPPPPIVLPPGAPPLSPIQLQKQQAELMRIRQAATAVSADPKLTPVQKQQKLIALKKKLDQDMLALLTPAQRKVVISQNLTVIKLRQAFLKQHQAEIAKSKQLGDTYTKSLTAAQKQRFRTIQQQAQAQAQKVQADPKMSQQVKEETLAAIGRDAQRQVLSTLTPTQRAQVKQYQAIETKLGQELAAYAKAHGQPL